MVVERGSLAGLEGILVEIKNRFRLVVSLTLLQRSVAVDLDRDCVRSLAPSFKPRPLPEYLVAQS